MRCDECAHWVIAEKTVYGDDSEIENKRCEQGLGDCGVLEQLTKCDFGCKSFVSNPLFDHIKVIHKAGAPWQEWIYGPCPDCKGLGCHMVELRPACGHCAGLGKVRYYDDGYIADKSWDHPKEKELKKRLREQGIIDPASLSDPGLLLAEARKRDEGVLEGGSL